MRATTREAGDLISKRYGLLTAVGLARLIGQTKRMLSPDFKSRLNRLLAEEALEQVNLGFAEQRDPDGKAWPPSRRAREQNGQTLRDRGRLQRSFTHKASSTRGFRIGTNVPYAAAHQGGYTIKPNKTGKRGGRYRRIPVGRSFRTITRDIHVPARRMVPDGELGPIWGKAFDDAMTDWMEDHFDD